VKEVVNSRSPCALEPAPARASGSLLTNIGHPPPGTCFGHGSVRDPGRSPHDLGARTKAYPLRYGEFAATPAMRRSDGSLRVAIILPERMVASRSRSGSYCLLVAPCVPAKSRATRTKPWLKQVPCLGGTRPIFYSLT